MNRQEILNEMDALNKELLNLDMNTMSFNKLNDLTKRLEKLTELMNNVIGADKDD